MPEPLGPEALEFEIVLEMDEGASSDDGSVERLGKYRLCHKLATGGMASVHLAAPAGATRPEEVVALKRIHPHLAEQRAFVEMFFDEARVASRIDHPNVCRVLDWGFADGAYYLTMEHLRGEPLAEVIRQMRRRGESDARAISALAARLCADAARGLHAAHELRDDNGVLLEVVHRDVSPHNLFVTYEGSVQLVDFGIARARGRFHHTETGTVKGKFAYMAPEQMLGLGVDRRADVYSLGVVLWELLAQEPLFRRKTESETIIAVTKGDRPRLRDVAPFVSPELEAIVDRCLARDPAGRWPSAAALAGALEGWLVLQGAPPGGEEIAASMHVLFPGGSARAKELAASVVARAAAAEAPGARPEGSGVRRRASTPEPRSSSTLIALGITFTSLATAAAMAAWQIARLYG